MQTEWNVVVVGAGKNAGVHAEGLLRHPRGAVGAEAGPRIARVGLLLL